LGTAGVVALSLGMNAQVQRRPTEPVPVVAEVAAPARANAPSRSRPRRANPTQRARKSAPSPAPLLAASLSGLDFGLGDPADGALAEATAALVGDMGASVMEADAVQAPPQAIERTPPGFPARARALGQSGWVTVSFVVDIDGSTQDVHVADSDPPGVFDEAAVAAVDSWRFAPGQQDGSPVAVRVRQTLRFELQ
jgi:protein TonB